MSPRTDVSPLDVFSVEGSSVVATMASSFPRNKHQNPLMTPHNGNQRSTDTEAVRTRSRDDLEVSTSPVSSVSQNATLSDNHHGFVDSSDGSDNTTKVKDSRPRRSSISEALGGKSTKRAKQASSKKTKRKSHKNHNDVQRERSRLSSRSAPELTSTPQASTFLNASAYYGSLFDHRYSQPHFFHLYPFNHCPVMPSFTHPYLAQNFDPLQQQQNQYFDVDSTIEELDQYQYPHVPYLPFHPFTISPADASYHFGHNIHNMATSGFPPFFHPTRVPSIIWNNPVILVNVALQWVKPQFWPRTRCALLPPSRQTPSPKALLNTTSHIGHGGTRPRKVLKTGTPSVEQWMLEHLMSHENHLIVWNKLREQITLQHQQHFQAPHCTTDNEDHDYDNRLPLIKSILLSLGPSCQLSIVFLDRLQDNDSAWLCSSPVHCERSGIDVQERLAQQHPQHHVNDQKLIKTMIENGTYQHDCIRRCLLVTDTAFDDDLEDDDIEVDDTASARAKAIYPPECNLYEAVRASISETYGFVDMCSHSGAPPTCLTISFAPTSSHLPWRSRSSSLPNVSEAHETSTTSINTKKRKRSEVSSISRHHTNKFHRVIFVKQYVTRRKIDKYVDCNHVDDCNDHSIHTTARQLGVERRLSDSIQKEPAHKKQKPSNIHDDCVSIDIEGNSQQPQQHHQPLLSVQQRTTEFSSVGVVSSGLGEYTDCANMVNNGVDYSTTPNTKETKNDDGNAGTADVSKLVTLNTDTVGSTTTTSNNSAEEVKSAYNMSPSRYINNIGTVRITDSSNDHVLSLDQSNFTLQKSGSVTELEASIAVKDQNVFDVGVHSISVAQDNIKLNNSSINQHGSTHLSCVDHVDGKNDTTPMNRKNTLMAKVSSCATAASQNCSTNINATLQCNNTSNDDVLSTMNSNIKPPVSKSTSESRAFVEVKHQNDEDVGIHNISVLQENDDYLGKNDTHGTDYLLRMSHTNCDSTNVRERSTMIAHDMDKVTSCSTTAFQARSTHNIDTVQVKDRSKDDLLSLVHSNPELQEPESATVSETLVSIKSQNVVDVIHNVSVLQGGVEQNNGDVTIDRSDHLSIVKQLTEDNDAVRMKQENNFMTENIVKIESMTRQPSLAKTEGWTGSTPGDNDNIEKSDHSLCSSSTSSSSSSGSSSSSSTSSSSSSTSSSSSSTSSSSSSTSSSSSSASNTSSNSTNRRNNDNKHSGIQPKVSHNTCVLKDALLPHSTAATNIPSVIFDSFASDTTTVADKAKETVTDHLISGDLMPGITVASNENVLKYEGSIGTKVASGRSTSILTARLSESSANSFVESDPQLSQMDNENLLLNDHQRQTCKGVKIVDVLPSNQPSGRGINLSTSSSSSSTSSSSSSTSSSSTSSSSSSTSSSSSSSSSTSSSSSSSSSPLFSNLKTKHTVGKSSLTTTSPSNAVNTKRKPLLDPSREIIISLNGAVLAEPNNLR